MTEKKLSTGKKVTIRKLSRSDIRKIKNKATQRIFPDGTMGYVGIPDVQDEWIDKGLAGLEDWNAKNGEIVPDNIIMRLGNDKKVETRRAKLRLSNIKIEEITQTLRNMSKHIKH